MYNIAKVAKGEILVYFNQVFDALCKVRSPQREDLGMTNPMCSLLPIRNCQSRMGQSC